MFGRFHAISHHIFIVRSSEVRFSDRGMYRDVIFSFDDQKMFDCFLYALEFLSQIWVYNSNFNKIPFDARQR